MIHMYSGDGKGKTSTAVGMAIRMAGAGKEVLFTQFMKGNESSEIRVLQSLPGVKVLKSERDYGFYRNMSDEDKQEITEKHNEILREILRTVRYFSRIDPEGNGPELLIVLDEITYPCRCDLVDEELLKTILEETPETVELVMTGRNPREYMVKHSDYWSDLKMRKHPYEKNVVARFGVEF